MSRERAGSAIRSSESKLSRLELGQVSFKTRDVADLLTLYGIADPGEHERVLELARKANKPGWWYVYADLMPDWFVSLVDLEQAAARIRTYEMQYVPGLLQTQSYARAVISQGNQGATQADIERRVALRMTRAELLTRSDPPRLWVVLDEAVLRRNIGGAAVMGAQLEHLLEAAKLPALTLQVLPFSHGTHSAEAGAFSLLRFPYADLPDLVYLEQLTGASYLGERRYVDPYAQAMDRLSAEAAEPQASIDLIADILDDTWRRPPDESSSLD